jgi:phosphonate degradation associated HDIG domain protein
MASLSYIIELLEGSRDAYCGEPLSQAEHALQAAHLAREASAPAVLVTAALLHDVGHLIHPDPSTVINLIDRRHEHVGADWLTGLFGPEITEPIRLHVAAKRYLCRLDQFYRGGLSPASIRSLELQGGPLNWAEVHEFEKNPYYRMAVQLRRWDDQAKVPGATVPAVESYREILRSCIKPE